MVHRRSMKKTGCIYDVSFRNPECFKTVSKVVISLLLTGHSGSSSPSRRSQTQQKAASHGEYWGQSLRQSLTTLSGVHCDDMQNPIDMKYQCRNLGYDVGMRQRESLNFSMTCVLDLYKQVYTSRFRQNKVK